LDEQAIERMEREENEKAKKQMFQALIDLDFTSSSDISLKKIISMAYRVDDEDEGVVLTGINIVKILKV
jgi:predicted rRNA methylase YqxC with S4 and FtsJ domains